MSLLSRARLWQLLGVPDPGSIRPSACIVGPVRRRDGLRHHRITLVHADGTVVPCLFVTPDADGPWPMAAVAVHQHNGQFELGKSEPAGLAGDPQMAYARMLAHSGIATLVPDLLGFEERRAPTTGDAAQEQSAAWQLVASGSTLQGSHVRDVALATSWLAGNEDVTGPIGIIGHSLGGQTAFFSLAADARLRAGVISCGIGTLESFEDHGVLHNPAWYVPNLRAEGDAPAVAAAISGQRVFVLSGRSDPIFPWDGVSRVVDAFADGVAEFVPFDGGHGFPPALADRAVAWLAARLGSARSAADGQQPA